MNIIRKMSHIPLAWFGVAVLLIGLAIMLKLTAEAQDSSRGITLPLTLDQDIGPARLAGGGQANGADSYVIGGAGSDIWHGSDSFHYVYRILDGNGEMVARVAGMEGTNGYAKAGVMIRETLNANSRNAMMLDTLSRGTFFQWRAETGGNSDQTYGDTNSTPARWLKIVRWGDWVGGYSSVDRENWTLIGWQTFKELPRQVYVGLAVTAHGNNNETNETVLAQFDKVNLGLADKSEVVFPFVGDGDGLLGSYYDNRHLFGKPIIKRVDHQVDFYFEDAIYQDLTNNTDFTNRCLDLLGIPRNREFGIRWTGELQAQFSELYTFHVLSDDGVRVWLNEKLIINNWNCQAPQESLARVKLVAGQKYLLRVEYFENSPGDEVSLAWSSPSTPEQVIPQSQLYSQPTDADGNGLPDLWEMHYFGRTGVSPNADPDGDGLSNLREYQCYSEPTNPLTWGVPNEWGHGDINGWGECRGDASYSNGVFTVTSSSSDIWHGSDSFHYVYRTLDGNGEMVARVAGMEGTNGYAKAGVMIRETLNANSRNAMMLDTLSQGTYFQWRAETGGNSDQTYGNTNSTSACWLKIVRWGDWVGGYSSEDGVNWKLTGWQTINGLASQVYVGLAVTAHGEIDRTNGPVQAQFDKVNLGSADKSEVIFPFVGNGDGLVGSYRNDSLLYLPGMTNRVDDQVYFDWLHDPPMQMLNPDSYGVCWSGEVQAQFTEPYVFSLMAHPEDWVRVWINDQLVIDGWRIWHPDGELTGMPVNLVAGRHYLIRIEMFNHLGKGAAILKWSSPTTPEMPVPQNQLYSQPVLDPDGSGLPVIWEKIYFGHTGVLPNADPDGDGLSNQQEYQYHTNPLKSDTDGDGIQDAWEIAHGLDPQFNDAGMDYDNAGWSNLQKFQFGLDPFNADVNDDGLPDSFELQYLQTKHQGAISTLLVTNAVTVAASVNGAQATSHLGVWQVDGNDIYCVDRRGGVNFNLTVSNADKYVLNLIGTQNQFNPFETKFKLLLGIDGQTLGHYTLNAEYGTNGEVELVLPYLQAGSHTVNVFWDGAASYSSLRIKQVKLLAVDDGDANQNGIKDWADRMIAGESGFDATNPVLGSYTSPVCLEGRDPFPSMMSITSDQTNVVVPTATTDGRWYVNVPVQGTQAVVQASYQNGALVETRQLQWQRINLLAKTNSMTMRRGDSLWLTALPLGATNGNLQITYGTNVVTGLAGRGVACRFTMPGTYTVTGTFTAPSGETQSGNLKVDVVQQDLPSVQAAAWTGMSRSLDLPHLAPETVLQADSRLTCYLAGTNANGGVQLALFTDANEERTILARLGDGGPVLDSMRVGGFDECSGGQTYVRVKQVYDDGSQLVEMLLISSPVKQDVTFVLEPIASGIIFEDGTIVKTLTASDFDALGQCVVRFIRPASVHTSVCHTIKAYQGNYQIGYRH